MTFRRLFKGVYGPILAACALVAVLWAGSYRSIAHAKLPVSPGGTRWELTSYRGVLSVALIENYPVAENAFFVARRADAVLANEWDEHYWSGSVGGFGFEDA